MSKKTLFLVSFLFSCADISFDDYTAYQPKNIQKIGEEVFQKNGLNFSDYKIKYYYGEDICNMGENHVLGCNYSEKMVVVVKEKYKDICEVLTHELTHQALFFKGDSDESHKNNQFDVVYINKLCLSIP